MTITSTGLFLWIALLLVIVVVIVPLAVSLLQRGLTAARAIETYFADMLTAGVGIAGNTAAVLALDQTIALAVAMKPVADNIETKTGVVAGLLTSRTA